MSFDYDQNFKTLNFRENPWTYKVGKGEQGVLLVEPYKSELLPYWKFRTPKEAENFKAIERFEIPADEVPMAGMVWVRRVSATKSFRGGKRL